MSESLECPPIDLAHLAQYTGGDARLDAEVLQLFSSQCGTTLERLESFLDGPDTNAWREAAHSLKGAASGIGAFAIVEMAGRAESANPDADHEKAADCLARLRESCEVVQAFIASYVKA